MLLYINLWGISFAFLLPRPPSMWGFFCYFLLLLLFLPFKNNLVSSPILPQFPPPAHPRSAPSWKLSSCGHSSQGDHLYSSVNEFVFKVDKNKSFSRTSGDFFSWLFPWYLILLFTLVLFSFLCPFEWSLF